MSASQSDATLLARLNALRQSNISLSKTPPSLAPDPESDPDPAPQIKQHSDLSSRFANLRSSSPRVTSDVNHEPYEVLLDESDSRAVAGELANFQRDAKVGRGDVLEARSALREAEGLIGKVRRREAEEEEKSHSGERERPEEKGNEDGSRDAGVVTEEDIDRLLEEMNLDREEGKDEDSGANDGDGEEDNDEGGGRWHDLKLPDTPSGLKELPKKQEEESGIDLPSVPSSAPQSQTNKNATSSNIFLQGTNKLADADVESWCIICCDDATLRCVGCDGDLYCGNCWTEGHRGPDVGLEERSHKALAFVKKDKKKPMKAAA